MRFSSPPKVKKQSKQKRQSGLDNSYQGDRELEKEKGDIKEESVCLKRERNIQFC